MSSMAMQAIEMGIDPCVDSNHQPWEGGINPIYNDPDWYLDEPEEPKKPYFKTFKEARGFAIKNPGTVITRCESGEGFTTK